MLLLQQRRGRCEKRACAKV